MGSRLEALGSRVHRQLQAVLCEGFGPRHLWPAFLSLSHSRGKNLLVSCLEVKTQLPSVLPQSKRKRAAVSEISLHISLNPVFSVIPRFLAKVGRRSGLAVRSWGDDGQNLVLELVLRDFSSNLPSFSLPGEPGAEFP